MWHKAMRGNKQGVCHSGAFAIYIKKYLKAKEELWKLKYFTMRKIQSSKSSSIKKIKILQNIITLLVGTRDLRTL
jgi:hypothetical protein